MLGFRRSRWFTFGVALGVVVPALALAVLSVIGSHSNLANQRRAFTEYEKAAKRAVQDGGFVVTQGMKPGLGDIARGSSSDVILVGMARGWKGSIEQVRSQLAAVKPPQFLALTASEYDQAFAAYADVGQALLAAAIAQGADRVALIGKVPELGRRADGLWDRASAELDRQRLRLGLRGQAPSSRDGPAFKG